MLLTAVLRRNDAIILSYIIFGESSKLCHRFNNINLKLVIVAIKFKFPNKVFYCTNEFLIFLYHSIIYFKVLTLTDFSFKNLTEFNFVNLLSVWICWVEKNKIIKARNVRPAPFVLHVY